MHVQKQQLEADMEQWTGSKFGKGHNKAICYHPVYLTYIEKISCEIESLDESQGGTKIVVEISTTSHMQIIPL